MEELDIFDLIYQRDSERIRSLLAAQPNALLNRKDGMTPLHYAIHLFTEGQPNEALKNTLSLLLDALANTDHINATDGNGNTSLDLALSRGAFDLALHILIRGGRVSQALLDNLLNNLPQPWANYRYRDFLTLLGRNRDCAALVACLLLGDYISVRQVGTLKPGLVNLLTNRAWYIFIDWALENGCDLAVVSLLPMVHRIPAADLFFRAFRRGGQETMQAILQMLPWDERLVFVLEVARRLMQNEEYNAALALLKFNRNVPNDPGFNPHQAFLTEDTDPNEGGVDFVIPPDCSLDQEDEEDQNSIHGATAANLLSSVILMTSTSDEVELLDAVIDQLGVDEDMLRDAMENCLPEMATDGSYKFIMWVCRRVNISRDVRTEALVNALDARHIKNAVSLLLCGASPNCCIGLGNWLSLGQQQGGQLQNCVIYQLLRTEENGQWVEYATKCTYLLLTFGGGIEFWDEHNPDQTKSVLCLAATAGHITTIRRAVHVGANPILLFEMACNNPNQTHMKEAVTAALEGLVEVLNLFSNVNSYEVISVLIRGLSAGVNGRGLIQALNNVATIGAFGEEVKNAALWCVETLNIFFSRERTLLDRCLITLINHPTETNLSQTLDNLGIQHAPVWMLAACSGDRPPSLTALLAWIKVLHIPDFAQEIELKYIVQWHSRRGLQQ